MAADRPLASERPGPSAAPVRPPAAEGPGPVRNGHAAGDRLQADPADDEPDLVALRAARAHLQQRVVMLESRLRQRDEQRRAMMHIMGDLHAVNQRLSNQRKAMIHIMSDLHDTTGEVQRREQELRDKQEQLVQAGKLATLGELTTDVAHELNNPLNNIGLFIGNAIDFLELGNLDKEQMLRDLRSAMEQVRKATAIISHLRTFGRAAPVGRERVPINEIIDRSLALLQEQFGLRQITVQTRLSLDTPLVLGSPIQLEQVFINLLTNARDAVMESEERKIDIRSDVGGDWVEIIVTDTGPGIPEGLEQRIFDPFFTTKGVGKGTGLGLSIAYGILNDHGGSIAVIKRPNCRGAAFLLRLPLAVEQGRDPAV